MQQHYRGIQNPALHAVYMPVLPMDSLLEGMIELLAPVYVPRTQFNLPAARSLPVLPWPPPQYVLLCLPPSPVP